MGPEMFAVLVCVSNKTVLSVIIRLIDVAYQQCQSFATSFVPPGGWSCQHVHHAKQAKPFTYDHHLLLTAWDSGPRCVQMTTNHLGIQK